MSKIVCDTRCRAVGHLSDIDPCDLQRRFFKPTWVLQLAQADRADLRPLGYAQILDLGRAEGQRAMRKRLGLKPESTQPALATIACE